MKRRVIWAAVMVCVFLSIALLNRTSATADDAPKTTICAEEATEATECILLFG